jgi:S-formylglutathione hydrolase FrmB
MFSRAFTKLTLILGCIIFLAATAAAQQAAQPAPAGRIIDVTVPAPSLKGNLLGDPVELKVMIYLPPGYDSSPAKHFPTLYLLHGFLGTNTVWTTKDHPGKPLQPMLDELIKNGKIQEMIVVAPSAWNTYKGSFYTNSSVTGNWEDYIYRDLVQHIDANYRTIARSESRGIAGHSMGGYGAMTLAMKHPDVFSVVYALSPCCFGMEGDFSSENPAWLKTVRLTSKEQLGATPKSFDDFYQMAFVALAAAFSPNPQRGPFYVDFPFEERNGKLEKNETIFAKWQARMPVYMVEENKANLLTLRGIFIDYGQKEEFPHIRITSQQFSKALSERSIPHIFEIYEGGNHGNKVRQRLETRLFQFFSETLAFDQK